MDADVLDGMPTLHLAPGLATWDAVVFDPAIPSAVASGTSAGLCDGSATGAAARLLTPDGVLVTQAQERYDVQYDEHAALLDQTRGHFRHVRSHRTFRVALGYWQSFVIAPNIRNGWDPANIHEPRGPALAPMARVHGSARPRRRGDAVAVTSRVVARLAVRAGTCQPLCRGTALAKVLAADDYAGTDAHTDLVLLTLRRKGYQQISVTMPSLRRALQSLAQRREQQ